MLILMTSPDAISRLGVVDMPVAQALASIKAAKHPVGVISNHAEPAWFQPTFGTSGVQFLQVRGRQSGAVVSKNAAKFGLQPFDALVLAAKDEDVQMGKNGGAVLIAAGWMKLPPQVNALGIQVATPQDLQQVITLTSGWAGQWWFTGATPQYEVRALSDLSSYNKSLTQQEFAQRLTATVKGGGARLNALLTVTARSLLMEGKGVQPDLFWGVYPSSKSSNDDSEVLSDFTHRLRTTVSRVRHSKRGQPLFIRHAPSSKRSAGGGGDRTDPSEQLMTVHLNPHYKKSLNGRNVVVVDDCTTYGVSFGVAAALLRKAGAASVTGVALGKFGNKLRSYDIGVNADPFKPLAAGDFSIVGSGLLPGSTSPVSQQTLQSLIP